MSIKPIHKFNGGRGATLCHKCKVIITTGLTDFLYCEKCDKEHFSEEIKKQFEAKTSYKYSLHRSDGLVRRGNRVDWVEWDADNKFKLKHDTPDVGRSLLIDGNHLDFTWLTTPVKEILEHTENLISFTTRNSKYELHKQMSNEQH